jgi:hypothetical protein
MTPPRNPENEEFARPFPKTPYHSRTTPAARSNYPHAHIGIMLAFYGIAMLFK